MDVRHLELLRELAERGSVTAVAAATHRTPSAVSQQLKQAQREFGVPLVQPDGRGLRLTEAGLLLAAGGTRVSTTVAEVRATWDAFRGEPSGTVRLAAPPSVATFLFAETMQALGEGAIELVCSDVDIAEAAFAGLTVDNDIVIGYSLTGPRPAGTDGLTVVPIAHEPLDVVMAADHPLAQRSTVTAVEVAGEDWVGVPEGFPFDTVLHGVEQVAGVTPRVVQRLRDNRLIESLVAANRTLAILPRFTTPSAASGPAGGVCLRELVDVPAIRHISAILRPDRAERLAVRHVLDALVDVGRRVERRHAVVVG
ncbi:LysR family transcriptional regulator [Propionibacteriaceae bacterium Y2011]